jgi:hypothetical protein
MIVAVLRVDSILAAQLGLDGNKLSTPCAVGIPWKDTGVVVRKSSGGGLFKEENVFLSSKKIEEEELGAGLDLSRGNLCEKIMSWTLSWFLMER